jgi:hypothetical protein
MRGKTGEPLSARLSWEEIHRLEVGMRMRASSLAKRTDPGSRCPACGAPLGDERVRLAGVLVHPGCLPSSVRR